MGVKLGCVTLLTGSQNDHCSRTGHSQDTEDSEHHGAVITGFGQIEATGVDHGQRSFCIGRAVILQHVDCVAVNSCGSGQQVVSQLLLGHVVQDISQAAIGLDVALSLCLSNDFLSKAGIILDQANNVRLVDVAQNSGLNLRNNDLDVFLQQGVAVVGTDLGDGV